MFDIKIPRMDGMELLRQLRAQSDLPVIFLTSKDQEQERRKPASPGRRLLHRKPSASGCCWPDPRDSAPCGAGAQTDGEPLVVPRRGTRIERGRLRMGSIAPSGHWDGLQVSLTVTEFLILEALAQRPVSYQEPESADGAAYPDDVFVDDGRSTAISSACAASPFVVPDSARSRRSTARGTASRWVTPTPAARRERIPSPRHVAHHAILAVT